MKNFKELLHESNISRTKNEIFSNYRAVSKLVEITDNIVAIHEYDIPIEVTVGHNIGIRCGCWYDISFTGEKYILNKNDRLTYPDLRVFTYDIETTKQSLKFPNSDQDQDQVMMISILTDSVGELIVNRNIVSEDILDFENDTKDYMKGKFKIYNELTEESLLIRFIDSIIENKPHIITTYNGGYFDWPFLDKRMQKYDISFYNSLRYKSSFKYYDCNFIIHLDCYKWVKRDSYLPMNNQGLKDVAIIKLGYLPDEIDPEDMVDFAQKN